MKIALTIVAWILWLVVVIGAAIIALLFFLGGFHWLKERKLTADKLECTLQTIGGFVGGIFFLTADIFILITPFI